jgi:hypothetical protein
MRSMRATAPLRWKDDAAAPVGGRDGGGGDDWIFCIRVLQRSAFDAAYLTVERLEERHELVLKLKNVPSG